MMHAKFQDHRTSCLEKKILKAFTIYGCGGLLGHVTWTIYTNFGSSFPRRPKINLDLTGQAISEKKIFENGGRTKDEGRTPARWVYYSSPCEPNQVTAQMGSNSLPVDSTLFFYEIGIT